MGASTAALAISIIALNESNNNKTKVCENLINNYKPNTATVSEMKGYAECINNKYPNEPSANDVIVLKVLFVIGLVSFIVGLIRGYKENHNDIPLSIMSGFLYGIGVPLLLIIIICAFIGIAWVFGY